MRPDCPNEEWSRHRLGAHGLCSNCAGHRNEVLARLQAVAQPPALTKDVPLTYNQVRTLIHVLQNRTVVGLHDIRNFVTTDILVQADGDELGWIRDNFKNIPIGPARVQRWWGDDAKFIAYQLPRS